MRAARVVVGVDLYGIGVGWIRVSRPVRRSRLVARWRHGGITVVYVYVYAHLARGLDERQVVDRGGLREGKARAVHDGDGAHLLARVDLW